MPGTTFSATGSQTMPTMKAATGTSMRCDVRGGDLVLLLQLEQRVEIRVQDVRGRDTA